MVTCSPAVDGGRWQEGLAEGELLQQQRKLSSSSSASALSASVSTRTLVYDVETGSLRYTKPSGRGGNLQPRSPKSPRSRGASFKLELENDEHLGAVVGDSHGSPPLCKKLHGENFFESGDSSPTCVIQNSALRSNSSSPTMSTISKTSSDVSRRSQDRETEGAIAETKLLNVNSRSPPEVDEETISSRPKSPPQETLKVGDVRERIRKLESLNAASAKAGLKGPIHRRTGNESKENAGGWSLPHDPTQNPPFKSIQCAMAMEVGLKKTKHGGIPVSRLADSSIMHCHKSPGIFSFNATYMSRAPDADLDFDFISDPIHGHAIAGVPSTTTAKVGVLPQQQQQQLDLSRRNFRVPLLKPTPSKWDDAEKWLPGSECQSAKSKSRSGPLLAQMVAAQAGMSISWKGPQIVHASQSDRHYTSDDFSSKNTLDLDSKPNGTRVLVRDVGTDMTPEGDHYPTTPDSDLDPKPTVMRVTTRDMGTAMTPVPSVEPSRTSTPLKRPSRDAATSTTTGPTVAEETSSNTSITASTATAVAAVVESPMTEKEFQEKTRLEIVALGNQLGKVNIAAAWTSREKEKQKQKQKMQQKQQQKQQKQEELSTVRLRSNGTLDLETLRRDVFASRAEAWQEAEKLKYTSRYEQEKAKIQVWEEHEKVKAEADMRRVELKAERMKSLAHEKLDQRLATTLRQAEELRLAAEARRAEAAAKATKKADILKSNGKLTNLLFLSFLCT